MWSKRLFVPLFVAALVAAPSSASASDSGDSDRAVVIDNVTVDASLAVETRAELNTLLQSSGTPLTVKLNPETGAIEAVEAAPPQTLAISKKNTCSTGDVCLRAPRVPYADNGFSGKGTATGSWSPKRIYHTGNWTATVKWLYGGKTVTGPKLGPNKTGDVLTEVTMTSVTIH